MILFCTCQHKYQDQKYGQGNRVHNRVPRKGLPDAYRCTVCEREREKEKTKIS